MIFYDGGIGVVSCYFWLGEIDVSSYFALRVRKTVFGHFLSKVGQKWVICCQKWGTFGQKLKFIFKK